MILAAGTEDYIRAYGFWKQGLFPNKGSWGEQPSKLVLAMEHIDGLIKSDN